MADITTRHDPNSTDKAVTPRGYWDGTQLVTGITRRDQVAFPPENPPDPPANTQKLGVSASATTYPRVAGNGESYANGYARQKADLKAVVHYFYGQSPRYSDFSGFTPVHHDVFLQTKASTKAEYDALLASLPASRQGKIYLHYWNEPENNIPGTFSVATWQARCDLLYTAIDDAIAARPTMADYVVKSVELMYYTLQQYNKGSTFWDSGRLDVRNYFRPGVQHVGWSNYAEKKPWGPNGGFKDPNPTQERASIDPVNMPLVIKTFHAKPEAKGTTWSSITGWALGYTYTNDATTIQNRVTWMTTAFNNLKAAGSKHFMWFDIDWNTGDSPGDYRVLPRHYDDPVAPGTNLAAWNAWTDLLAQEGQVG